MEYNILTWPYPIPKDDLVLSLVYDGEPISKQRVRFGAGGTVYTPAKTRHYEKTIGWELRAKLQGIEPDSESKFALRCIFYRSNRQRIDCDNLIKAISDAATGVVWQDDNQVLEVIGRLFLKDETPRVEVAIYRIPDTTPAKNCLHCGKRFNTPPSVDSNHCSMECRNNATHVKVTCKECSKEFEIVQSLAKKRAGFCSRDCSVIYHGRQKRRKGSDLWICQDCGGSVSRKEYVRCRSCSMKHRSDPTSNYWRVRHEIK